MVNAICFVKFAQRTKFNITPEQYRYISWLDAWIHHEYLRLNLRENLEQSLSSLVN